TYDAAMDLPMTETRGARSAVIGALALGALMTFGDFLWAVLHLRHRTVYGIAHGAVMCLCIGLLVAGRQRYAISGALWGLAIGVAAAGAFYTLAPFLRLGAMLPAWRLFWILFAVLQQRFGGREALRTGARPGRAAGG